MNNAKREELRKACKKIHKIQVRLVASAWYACLTCPWRRLPTSKCTVPRGSATGCAVTTGTLNATLSVAGTRAKPDGVFVVRAKNAVSNLFALMCRLGMEPGNNEFDACDGGDTLQDVPRVDDCQRKAMFGTIMICLLMWDKQGLNWFEKLSEAFWTKPIANMFY